MVKLTLSALPALSPAVAVPAYDPRAQIPGIVHFGVGAFHRSHQAMYLDRLLNSGRGAGWAICGVGVLPQDARMRDVLAEQDHLYTLVTRSPDGQAQARVIGAIVEFLFAPDDPERVLERLADPTTRIVSLTVTEGGYSVSNATGEFDPTPPDIAHDLTPGAVPRTFFGFLTEGLRRRRERGLPPFTVVSCDNMPGNGEVTRRALTAFARLQDPELGDWIAHNVAFPNSMVDRITPATTEQDRQDIAAAYGIEDAWPVVAESFAQWVLEDRFTQGRPALETVGVQVVSDVEPYELMKLRLLNASHQALAYLGLLAGYRFVHEVCQDPLFARFLLDYMTQEATPTLRPVPGIDLGAYRRELIARFSNPAIRDPLTRLTVDSSERIPKFLLPVIRDQLARGGELARCALVIASWRAYLATVLEEGSASFPDQHAQALAEAVRRDAQQPGAFLDLEAVFGELGRNARFRTAYLSAWESLRRQGPLGAMRALMGEESSPSNVTSLSGR
ncbi:Mannitol dehydrogenase-like protein (plasmid) [Deinococcus geothermalis DSM 11300]|uniref:Mannitol dehydrogenase-like protein n=1 Tax=Deinococcus geothermalis (strain DSM 11300 / CIP 105573 / AG-3a) TaxID=319795 RepID=Q1J2I9_DEIGD|nr:mannitol dehydrogenase family protein [Deinococcus geothermalis]ABF44295.1 Mannitol dehydrogenase-like protein [Deinococcus geothermalis DSM 11300]